MKGPHHVTAILADIPGFGRIFDCGECANIHFQIGAMTLTLSPEAFLQLAAMISEGAASFNESWEGRSRTGFLQDTRKEYTQ